MFSSRIQSIIEILDTFSGKDGEPGNDAESYILRSMWVMMLSEFEGSLKDLVDLHIDNAKKSPISEINICLLLQNFYPNKTETFSLEEILSMHKKDAKDITYKSFTRDNKPKYKLIPVEKLFNTLGVFFSAAEFSQLKALDGIASTRDSIAHGDSGVQITKKELEERTKDIEAIFNLLKSKLKI